MLPTHLARLASALLVALGIAACESADPRDTSPVAIGPDTLLAAAQAKLYRAHDLGLVDLRAHFAVHVTAEPKDESARDVDVGGEFLWKAPDRVRVIPSEDPVHAMEAMLAFDAYQGFFDSCAVDLPLRGLRKAKLKRHGDGIIECLSPSTASSDALGFERVKSVLVQLDADALPNRITIHGKLTEDASREHWPGEHEETFGYQRVGDRFALSRMTSTMPSGVWEVTAQLREIEGFTIPTRLDFVIRPAQASADDPRRGLITLTLDAIRVNAGIDDRELEVPEKATEHR